MSRSELIFNIYRDNSSFWYQKSVALYASATLIWDAMSSPEDRSFLDKLDLNGDFSVSIGCEHPYLMLFGSSYEVILKAICIEKGMELKQIHKLQRLAECAGVSLSEKENTQLGLLSEFIEWDGRYPVPTKHETMTQHRNSTNKALWQTESFFGVKLTSRTEIFEYESLKELWLKLSNDYNNIRKKKQYIKMFKCSDFLIL